MNKQVHYFIANTFGATLVVFKQLRIFKNEYFSIFFLSLFRNSGSTDEM